MKTRYHTLMPVFRNATVIFGMDGASQFHINEVILWGEPATGVETGGGSDEPQRGVRRGAGGGEEQEREKVNGHVK